MATWQEVNNEIIALLSKQVDPKEYVQGHLDKLKEVTEREIICYYSGFLTKNVEGIDIKESDMIGFMNACKGLDYSKGLDLILHTPGGSPAAAEHIVNYLRDLFNGDIRVIVPHMAMSAGTMIAFSAKEIVMGKHSSLGPIDPQYNGIPAVNIKELYETAKDELANNQEHTSYWAIELQKFPPAFLKNATDAIDLSEILAKSWLGSAMFDGKNEEDKITINKIISEFNDNASSKIHGRHYNYKKCMDLGLKIKTLESDPDLQDAVLSIHHCYTVLLESTTAIKIIENGNGIMYINNRE